MTQPVEWILNGADAYALIVRATHQSDGPEFFTPGTYSQQLGSLTWPAGHLIAPHLHNPVRREVEFTNEVLFIRHGRIRVDFYSDTQEYLESRELVTGDVILLIRGGHRFEVLEPTSMFEVKQGPYAGESDKTRFVPQRIGSS